MNRDLDPGNSYPDHAIGEVTQMRLLEEKRRYIREYMRRWRARPEHQTVEHRNRRRCYHRRRTSCPVDASQPAASSAMASMCAICRKRPSVTTIVRLRLLDKSPYNYAEMRVPYCGEC